MERRRDGTIPLNKPPVRVSKPKESLKLFMFLWCWSLFDCLDFGGIHGNVTNGKDEA